MVRKMIRIKKLRRGNIKNGHGSTVASARGGHRVRSQGALLLREGHVAAHCYGGSPQCPSVVASHTEKTWAVS